MTASDQALDSLALAARAADSKGGEDLVALDVSGPLPFTDVFLLVTGNSERNVVAIADEVEDVLREAGAKTLRREGHAAGPLGPARLRRPRRARVPPRGTPLLRPRAALAGLPGAARRAPARARGAEAPRHPLAEARSISFGAAGAGVSSIRCPERGARVCGAAGSAPAWHAGGQGFESPQIHQHPRIPRNSGGFVVSGAEPPTGLGSKREHPRHPAHDHRRRHAPPSPTTGDQVVMVVNVASRCGLTPQYEKLEALQREYGDRGFTVLGFPCNQFAGQEPGDAEDIKEFCSMTYGVSFPLMQKVKVNGRHRHPLYAELTKVPDAAGKAGRVEVELREVRRAPRRRGRALPPGHAARRPGDPRRHRARARRGRAA